MNFLDVLDAAKRPVFSRRADPFAQTSFERGIENLLDQGALSRTGNTGDTDKKPEGNIDGQVFQIVFPCAFDSQYSLPIDGAAL